MATKKTKSLLTQKLLKIGTWIRWESQSQGSWVTKVGEVIAHLKAGDHISDGYALKDGKALKTPAGLVRVSQHDRVVVAVLANENTGLRKLYAPTANVLIEGDFVGAAEVRALLKKSEKKAKK